eukprot:6585205-Alexandrium_andersonii.AAC.1
MADHAGVPRKRNTDNATRHAACFRAVTMAEGTWTWAACFRAVTMVEMRMDRLRRPLFAQQPVDQNNNS